MTEKDIIKGCQKNKPKYQRELVNRYGAMLLTVSRRYCRDQATAQDVLQESLIKIFHVIDRYQPTGSFEAWMRRIVINMALRHLDKSFLKRELPNLEIAEEPIEYPAIYSQLGAEELMNLIAQLPDGYREVFNLFVVEGFSHKEIAQFLEITESTSRSQLTRARKMLQRQIIALEKIRV